MKSRNIMKIMTSALTVIAVGISSIGCNKINPLSSAEQTDDVSQAAMVLRYQGKLDISNLGTFNGSEYRSSTNVVPNSPAYPGCPSGASYADVTISIPTIWRAYYQGSPSYMEKTIDGSTGKFDYTTTTFIPGPYVYVQAKACIQFTYINCYFKKVGSWSGMIASNVKAYCNGQTNLQIPPLDRNHPYAVN
jgi:hypothetical protein